MKIFRLPRWLLPLDRKLEAQLEKFSAAVEDGGQRLEAIPFLDGVYKENVEFAGGHAATIYHGLNRIPRGWFVVRAGWPITYAYSEIERDKEKLILQASGAGKIDLWIF